MFLRKIILSSFLVFVTAFAAQAQKSASDWSIAEYFENLPAKYTTASGDFRKPTVETIVVDKKNGYAAAYLNSSLELNESFPIFEMALFKSQSRPSLLVVSNVKSDHVCTEHETFFLRRVGSVWVDVEREVLPPLDLKMFWDKAQSAARFKKIVEQDNSTSFHFEPPRNGTRMKVSLEICDQFLEITPLKSVDELTKLIASTKPVYLNWDKQNGKFIYSK